MQNKLILLVLCTTSLALADAHKDYFDCVSQTEDITNAIWLKQRAIISGKSSLQPNLDNDLKNAFNTLEIETIDLLKKQLHEHIIKCNDLKNRLPK